MIKDCTFKAVQTYNPTSNYDGPSVMIYTITVEDGGKLIIDNSWSPPTRCMFRTRRSLVWG